MGKVYNGIMGLVVGDALGVPVEFKQRDTFHVTDMMGFKRCVILLKVKFQNVFKVN